jgi:hypothetical protein
MLAWCTTPTRGLNRVIFKECFHRPSYALPFVCLRSTMHTASSGFKLSPYLKARNSPPRLYKPSQRFLAIDNKSDREYINARCTTISPLVQPQRSETSCGSSVETVDNDLRIETTHKVSKVQLCHDNGIQPRDLRSLDTDMVLVEYMYTHLHHLIGCPVARSSFVYTGQIPVYIIMYTQYPCYH